MKQFNNGTCSGTPAAATAEYTEGADAETPTGGTYLAAPIVEIDPVLTFAPGVGTYSFLASYGGDPQNLAADGVCEGPVTVVAPDLTPTKVNDTGDQAALGESWIWTITVSNSGATANFANGQVILTDNLPGAAGIYSAFSGVVSPSGVTGTSRAA